MPFEKQGAKEVVTAGCVAVNLAPTLPPGRNDIAGAVDVLIKHRMATAALRRRAWAAMMVAAKSRANSSSNAR
jgi:hypothetical protein